MTLVGPKVAPHAPLTQGHSLIICRDPPPRRRFFRAYRGLECFFTVLPRRTFGVVARTHAGGVYGVDPVAGFVVP